MSKIMQMCADEIAGYLKRIADLEAKLAEKEKTIEEINKEFVQAVKDWKSLVEKKNKDIVELEEHDNLYHNQLAIEQLEKLKKQGRYFLVENKEGLTGFYVDVEVIDNQIKELRGKNV